MSITRGKRKIGYRVANVAALQSIYDRLRKRSLRQSEAYEEILAYCAASLATDEDVDAVFEERIDFYNMKGKRIDVAHQAYVRGVSDALKAVEEG